MTTRSLCLNVKRDYKKLFATVISSILADCTSFVRECLKLNYKTKHSGSFALLVNTRQSIRLEFDFCLEPPDLWQWDILICASGITKNILMVTCLQGKCIVSSSTRPSFIHFIHLARFCAAVVPVLHLTIVLNSEIQ